VIRVALLLEDLEFGGTQRQALELASGLDPARFDVELWIMRAGYDLVPPAERAGIPVTCLSRSRLVGPGSLLGLWRRLRSHPVDILVLLTVIPNIWGRLIGRMAKVPVILATCRGGGSPVRQHEKWLRSLADHLICNTSELERVLTRQCGVPAHRITMIPNGVDTAYFQPSADRSASPGKTILCVARLVPDKDHETLIAAFGLVAKAHPDARLWLVGNGTLLPVLQRLAARAAPPGSVRFLPACPDPRPFFRAADLFVLSSRREALSNAVLEAMSSGLAVVAAREGGLPEVVEHGRTGFLVPGRDVPALARAVTRLLSDDELRARFGAAGRRRAESRYSVAAMVRGHERVFECLYGGRPRAGR